MAKTKIVKFMCSIVLAVSLVLISCIVAFEDNQIEITV
jgi:hypothetical protein